MKAFKSFIRAFQAPQKSVKILSYWLVAFFTWGKQAVAERKFQLKKFLWNFLKKLRVVSWETFKGNTKCGELKSSYFWKMVKSVYRQWIFGFVVKAYFHAQLFLETALDNETFCSFGVLWFFKRYPKCQPMDNCFVRSSDIIASGKFQKSLVLYNQD